MTWEKLSRRNRRAQLPPNTVSINNSGVLQITSIYDQLGHDYVEIFYDADSCRLALSPVPNPSADTFRITKVSSTNNGRQINIDKVIKALESEHIKRHRYPVIREGDMFVIDLNQGTPFKNPLSNFTA